MSALDRVILICIERDQKTTSICYLQSVKATKNAKMHHAHNHLFHHLLPLATDAACTWTSHSHPWLIAKQTKSWVSTLCTERVTWQRCSRVVNTSFTGSHLMLVLDDPNSSRSNCARFGSNHCGCSAALLHLIDTRQPRTICCKYLEKFWPTNDPFESGSRNFIIKQ